MSFIDKVMFWKHDDDLGDLGSDEPFPKVGEFNLTPDKGDGLGNQPAGPPDFSNKEQFPQGTVNEPSAFAQKSSFQTQQTDNSILEKDIEVISSKLDALKASLDSINQRIINIENIAKGEQEPRVRW